MHELVKVIFRRSVLALAIVAVILTATAAQATTFTGIVYFTFDNGVHPNVYSQTYSYDDTTNLVTMGAKTVVADVPGADGLILSPQAGHLFVGGEGNPAVYDVTIATGTHTTITSPHDSFHLALNPNNSTLYSSDYYSGQTNGIDVIPLPAGPGVNHALTGTDQGVTQIAFAPTTGNVFYTASHPNCCGNVGTINLTTFATTQLFSAVLPAHSIIYDPFTGLMDMFGIGVIGTMDQSGGSLKISAQFDSNSDQGSVDNLGHAFIAGGDDLDFVDYATSADITNPNHFIVQTGYTDIDDVVVVPTPPPPSGICPLSQGYWKQHANAWPSDCLPMMLGTSHTYSESQLLTIMKTPVRGNASRSLAYQLIAAKLNICAGADGTPVAATIADADSLIGSGVIGGGYSKSVSAQMNADAKILDSYNNGCLTSGCSTCVE